jgi:hypothetical protein
MSKDSSYSVKHARINWKRGNYEHDEYAMMSIISIIFSSTGQLYSIYKLPLRLRAMHPASLISPSLSCLPLPTCLRHFALSPGCPYPAFLILPSLSCLPHPAFLILPSSSCLPHTAFLILHSSSFLPHPAFLILPSSSCIHHPSFLILPS